MPLTVRVGFLDKFMKRWQRLLFAVGFLLLCTFPLSGQDSKTGHSYRVYVGTYTDKGSKGIYSFDFDSSNGKSTAANLAAESSNPSFLTIDPNRPFLYAVNEVSDFNGQKSGAVSAFAIDAKSSQLKFLNQVASRGAGPCHLELDKSGKFLLVANYDSGNL